MFHLVSQVGSENLPKKTHYPTYVYITMVLFVQVFSSGLHVFAEFISFPLL